MDCVIGSFITLHIICDTENIVRLFFNFIFMKLESNHYQFDEIQYPLIFLYTGKNTTEKRCFNDVPTCIVGYSLYAIDNTENIQKEKQ